MSSSDKFNLTFNGDIRPGLNLTEVKLAFAQALKIEDAKRVDAFFSGEAVTLRRNVDKETAETFYTKMYRTGAILKLLPADGDQVQTARNPGMSSEFHTESPGQVDQSWPIPSKQEAVKPQLAAKKKPAAKKKRVQKPPAASKAKPKPRKKRPSKAALAKAAEEAAIQEAIEEAASNLKREAEHKTEAAEEAARMKAETEAARLKAKKEAALAVATAEAAEKKAVEEATKRKAEKKSAEKRAAEEAALKQALAAADREIARREAVKKKAAEDAALTKAAKQAALKKAREEQAKKRAMEIEAARIREEYAENKRIAAAKVARDRAEKNRRRAEKKVRLAQQKLNDAIASVALLEQETEKAKTDLKKLAVAESAASQSLAGKSKGENRQSSGLKHNTKALNSLPVSRQKRQSGAPNFFSLRPFRATTLLARRAEQSGQLSKTMYLISGAAIVALVLLLARTALQATGDPGAEMAKSMIVDESFQLTIAAASHLFILDRAGVATQRYALSDFGLPDDIQLLSGNHQGGFIVQVLNRKSDTDAAAWSTLDCDTLTRECMPYSGELGQNRISSWVANGRTKNSFVAIPSTETLLKFSPEGELIARASVKMPAQANLQLNYGLLYINSTEGTAISILLPDNADFGQQLDQIILLPPAAVEAGQTWLKQFVWGANAWWVLLANPETDQTGVYRFNEQWDFLNQVQLGASDAPQSITAWAGKVLFLYSQESPLQRFNADGEAEAPIILKELQTMVENQQSTAQWMKKLWWALMAFLALAAVFSFILAQLYRITQLIDKTSKFSDAQGIESLDSAISWVNLAANRNQSFRVLSLLYAASGGLILATIFTLQLPAAIMLAAGIALTGPALLIGYIWTSPTGHIGLVADGLVLVDHSNIYHVGAGSKIHHCNNFLLMDDVVVFKGSWIFPVFDKNHILQHVLPKVVAGVKVDRKTLWIKAFQNGHPIAKGLLACLLSFTVALLCGILL